MIMKLVVFFLTFDKVRRDGLIFKLQENGISGNLLKVLTNKKQRVVLNGQSSSWTNVKAGVPEDSILGPLLFLIYINDLANGLSSNTKLFADDTSLFFIIHDSVIIIYNQAYNLSFPPKLESIQCNAALALTGAIRGSSREKLYQKLGLESLQQRRWYRKQCCFYKIYNKQGPVYLTELIPNRNEAYQTRHFANIPSLSFKHDFFKNAFFPSTILELNKLDPPFEIQLAITFLKIVF